MDILGACGVIIAVIIAQKNEESGKVCVRERIRNTQILVHTRKETSGHFQWFRYPWPNGDSTQLKSTQDEDESDLYNFSEVSWFEYLALFKATVASLNYVTTFNINYCTMHFWGAE